MRSSAGHLVPPALLNEATGLANILMPLRCLPDSFAPLEMLMKPVTGFACAMLVVGFAPPAHAQGVDYHKGQQAGKVWDDKVGENNRRAAQARNAQRNSQGVRYDAPLTQRDREAALSANRAAYQRLHGSVGKKNADRWLDFKARALRARR
jgi:hypothetical protein